MQKNARSVPRVPKYAKKCPKLAKNYLKVPKNVPKGPKNAQNVPKVPKFDQKCPPNAKNYLSSLSSQASKNTPPKNINYKKKTKMPKHLSLNRLPFGASRFRLAATGE